MLKLYVRCCSAISLPQKHQDFKWFLASYVFPKFGGQMQGSKQHFGPRLGPSLAILGPVKVSGSYSTASWGKVGGSWGQVGLSGGHVEAKLGYVMLKLYVRFCSAMLLVLHPEMLPPSRTKILSGFLRAMLAVGSIWGQVRLPCGYVGAILRPTSAILGPRWRLYGISLDHVALA